MSDEVKVIDRELENVAGGNDGWEEYAKGKYVNYGSYIVYTVAQGDVVSGIAIRFGVTNDQIKQWNNLADVNRIYVGQKLTIYPTILR